MSQLRISRHYRIRGRVQGVGFRYFVREAAQGLGIDGWVRNCSDGTVEAIAQGDSLTLQQLEERLRTGPSWSQVADIEIRQAETENLSGFVIRF